MKNTDFKKLIHSVEEVSRRAGAEIMKHYGGTNIYLKDDGSHVTDADHASENIILPALRQLTPDIPIVSEERVAAGEIPDTSGGIFWTVDPLDGTKEFINKTGAFVVAIALISENKPVLGVIYHPVMDLMYSAAGPGTASKVAENAKRIALPAGQPPEEDILRVLINETGSDMSRIDEYLSKKWPGRSKIDTKSGILRACQVADGLADASVVYTTRKGGRVAWWDVAPGHIIVESVGGTVQTLDGSPLIYKDEDLQVGPHVVIRARL